MSNLTLSPQIKALLFDFDGTLVDSHPAHHDAWKQAMAKVGATITEEDLHAVMGFSSHNIAKKFCSMFEITDVEPSEIVKNKDELYIQNLSSISYNTKVMNCVLKYHNTHRLAVVTNEDADVFEHVIKYFDLYSYFAVIVSHKAPLLSKPAPDLFLKCAELLQLSPSECHVVEDSQTGLEAARQAGMSFTNVIDIN